MKKKVWPIIICLIPVLLILGVILKLHISRMQYKKKHTPPPFSYTEEIIVNQTESISFDISIALRAPEPNNLILPMYNYYAVLHLYINDNESAASLGDRPDGSIAIATTSEHSTPSPDEFNKEANRVLQESHLTDDFFTESDFEYSVLWSEEKNGYVVALKNGESRANGKDHIGILFVYEKETEEIIFLAKIKMSDDFCFDKLHTKYNELHGIEIIR